ncbi:MAG: glycosyltransferase [Hydrogeniiclostridium mannosilyticum]
MDNKVISVMIPTYNEEENARPIYEAVKNEIQTALPEYDYEILFIDNKSQDSTRHIIESICAEDPKVKAIFNAKNFGQFNSPYYGLIHTTGIVRFLYVQIFRIQSTPFLDWCTNGRKAIKLFVRLRRRVGKIR